MIIFINKRSTEKGDKTLTELSRQYGINSNLIVKWKKQLIENSNEVFASGKRLAPDRESESVTARHGHLTMKITVTVY